MIWFMKEESGARFILARSIMIRFSKARWGKVRRNKAICIIGPLFLFFCFGPNTRSGIILLDPRYINPTCQHAGQLRTDFIHSRAGVHRYNNETRASSYLWTRKGCSKNVKYVVDDDEDLGDISSFGHHSVTVLY